MLITSNVSQLLSCTSFSWHYSEITVPSGWEGLIPDCTLNLAAVTLLRTLLLEPFFFLPPPDISSENFGTTAGEFIHKVQSVSRTWHGEPFYLKYWCALELLPPLHFQNQSHFCRYHIQEKLLSKALDQLLIHDRKLFIIKGTVREAGAAQAQREYGASAGWLLKSMSGGTEVCQRSSSFVFIICLNTKNS